MGAKSWLDRVFRGEGVTEAEYGARETHKDEEPVDPMEVFARHSAAAFAAASASSARKDNLVEFSRAKAGAASETAGFGGTIYDKPEPGVSARADTGKSPVYSAKDFVGSGSFSGGSSGGSGGSAGGSSAGGSGGGFSGFGSSKATGEAGDAYVVFKRLKDFTMASHVADRMTEGKIVILNLENCDDEIARRVLDFIGGVAYACGSMVKRIAGRVFMITPKGVSADGEFFDEARESASIRYDD